jgi:hypothetical protein
MTVQKQDLSPFAKVAFESLKEANPSLPEEDLKEIARSASTAASEQLAIMVESGADPWAAREQVLNDLSNLGASSKEAR